MRSGDDIVRIVEEELDATLHPTTEFMNTRC